MGTDSARNRDHVGASRDEGTDLRIGDVSLVGTRFDVVQAFILKDQRPSSGTSLSTELPLSASWRRTRGAYGARTYLPEEQGVGFWDWLRISDDLLVSTTEATYATDTWIGLPPDRCVKVRILLSGALLAADRSMLMKGPDGCLQVLNGEHATGYFVAGKQPLRMVILHARPSLLSTEFDINLDSRDSPLLQVLQHSFNGLTGAKAGLAHGALQAARDILDARSRFLPELRPRYLQAKSTELLCAALQSLNMPVISDSSGHRYSDRDIKRIFQAHDILALEYAQPPTIRRLSRLVAMNQTKLKAGFRAVFGQTIFDYVARCRMEKAIELLTSSQVSVAEVAYQVGYNYPANFTHAFKRHFGRLPSALRQGRCDGEFPLQ